MTGCALLLTVALAPQVNPLLDPNQFTDGRCLQHVLHGQPRTGVADFQTGRALAVYSPPGTTVLQVLPNLWPFAWLVNLGSFAHQTITFLLVDRVTGAPVGLVAQDTKPLGPPTSISTCPGFYFYSYPPGTKGFTVLNAIVDSWYVSTVRQRH